MLRLDNRVRVLLVSGCLLGAAVQAQASSFDQVDPWELLNRKVFTFNTYCDTWLLRPVAKLYHHLPDPVETGIGNFFGNLQEPSNVLNNLLQWKFKSAGRDTGRFLVNTTAGLGGFVNIADKLGWKNSGGEDFGQTFRYWGIPEGPYLMVPVLGAFTVTDLVALPLDFAANPASYLKAGSARYGASGLKLVDKRANFFEAEALLPVDDDPAIERDKRYLAIRSAFLQNREFKTQDGQVKDDFGVEPE